MKRSRIASVVLLIFALAMASMPADAVVRDAKEISADDGLSPPDAQPGTTAGADVAVDPNNPNHVVSVYQQGRFVGGSSPRLGVARSSDGGATWQRSVLRGLTDSAGGV